MKASHYIPELKKAISGEVLTDENSLGMYATDASVYQIFPKVIVVPKNEADIVSVHKIAFKYKISILPRGAGTSLAGQTVGESIVIDFNKYMNKIIDLDVEKKSVKVEPGIIHAELNSYLKKYKLLYGPDPATTSRANMGGVVANNSSGSRSIVFGKAIDHIIDMRVILDDGEILEFKDIHKDQIKKKISLNTREGEIYKELNDIIEEDIDLIIDKFPKVSRRVSGYSLDEFVDKKEWNLGQLICGSEGTLATILDMTLSLVDLPVKRGMLIVHYYDRIEAISEVKNILPFGPSAIELLDDNLINIALENPSTKETATFIEGKPGAILLVEFFGSGIEEIEGKCKKIREYFDTENLSYAYPYYPEGEIYNNIWEIRKKGLGLLLSMRTQEKPIAFIEDACIPVESLASYIQEIENFCRERHVKIIIYAHASVGVLHVRPILNLRLEQDIRKFEEISNFTLSLVIKYKGSFSGEHGDGIVRSFGIPKFFGDKIYEDFKRIKKVFDPYDLMNPGKIIESPPITSHLRYGTDYKDQKIESIYHYRKELSFESLIHMCNGVGLCQRQNGGVMCPSYKASLDEKDSTRGRANALRLTLSNQLNGGDFTHDELMQVLDLCVSCKSCKTECPSNVDIAKLKSEVTQMKYDKKGYGLREAFIIFSDDFSKLFSGFLSHFINPVIKTKLFRYSLQFFAKIDARRTLDTYASKSLDKWFNRHFEASATGKEVVLFADTYISYHQVEIGRAIISLLDKMNFKVILVNTGGSKRPLISNGFLKKAKGKGEKIAKQLMPYLDKKTPIIVCEPSAYSALVEDHPDLMEDEGSAKKMQEGIISLERFFAEFISENNKEGNFVSKEKHHLIHAHCHQKAMEGTKYLQDIFENVDGTYDILEAGCCGMAGAFGFEKEHYDFSKKIFDGDLGYLLKSYPNGHLVLATGFSCRHQIDELSSNPVKHWVEVLDYIKQ